MKNTLLALTALAATSFAAQAQNLTTELVAQGFARPVFATFAPGDTGRLFVCEQHTGRVEIVDLAGRPDPRHAVHRPRGLHG